MIPEKDNEKKFFKTVFLIDILVFQPRSVSENVVARFIEPNKLGNYNLMPLHREPGNGFKASSQTHQRSSDWLCRPIGEGAENLRVRPATKHPLLLLWPHVPDPPGDWCQRLWLPAFRYSPSKLNRELLKMWSPLEFPRKKIQIA
jgi:hypothetical protein